MKKGIWVGAVASLGALAASPLNAATAKQARFGTLPDGREVKAVTLTNERGVSATVISYGASLQSVVLPDQAGQKVDVAPGHANMDGYLKTPNYFGATVGRVANRVAAGRFTLDGKTYSVPVNDGPNSLHGGTTGFDKVLWEVVEVASGATAKVTLRYVSPDGDQGYPGKLTVLATYSLNERNELVIDYKATTDKTTVVNISNHAYWNLAGEGSAEGAMGHIVTIPAETYTPVDATLIPTGEFKPVEGTVFDFRTPRAVNDRVRDGRDPQIVYGRGYDHNWVIGRSVTKDQHLMARVVEPVSGRGFELWSNQPGLQFYSGNFFNATVRGKQDQIYRMGDAIVLEPQGFPDTVNQPALGSARLEPGQTYHNVMTYRFTTTAPAAKR